jgi:CheY-like chemotaxis protein
MPDMGEPLRVLIVEDSEDDALLLIETLESNGRDVICERVDNPAAMTNALEDKEWDVVIADHGMPHFSAPASL